MLLACQFATLSGAGHMILPAPVPRSYKTSDAIARHKENARRNALDLAAETAACLQPTGAIAFDGVSYQRPTGPIATWLLGVLYEPIVIAQQTIWTFQPALIGRVVALSCLRIGQQKVPPWLFLRDRFRDPFRLMFGSGRLDRSACLAGIGVRDLADDSLDEQIRLLKDLTGRLDLTVYSADRPVDYGPDHQPSWATGGE